MKIFNPKDYPHPMIDIINNSKNISSTDKFRAMYDISRMVSDEDYRLKVSLISRIYFL